MGKAVFVGVVFFIFPLFKSFENLIYKLKLKVYKWALMMCIINSGNKQIQEQQQLKEKIGTTYSLTHF